MSWEGFTWLPWDLAEGALCHEENTLQHQRPGLCMLNVWSLGCGMGVCVLGGGALFD